MLNGLSFVTEVLFTNWLVCSTYLTAELFYGYGHHAPKDPTRSLYQNLIRADPTKATTV